MQLKISVVIPTYKRPKLLIKCLNALCAQDLDKSAFEVIIVSDGPDEITLQVIEQWFDRKEINLVFLHTPEKEGPAAARNLGWRSARAFLVAFTDDDCMPDKHWLNSFLEAYHHTGTKAAGFTGKTLVPAVPNPTDFAANTAHLATAEFITANCACTKDALLSTGGFDERFRLAWREDSDLFFSLLDLNIPVFSAENAIVTHPVRDAEWGISIKEQKKGAYDALLFKKHPQFYRSKIGNGIMLNYYPTILLWCLLFYAIWINSLATAIIVTFLLLISIGTFFYRRLKYTSKSINHVFEMLVTSIVIPFLSIYWRIYGAIKFRVFFI